MKTKKRDMPYCGVDEDRILNAHPVLNWENMSHFRDFVIDRYRVHKRKDIDDLPAPWTNNPIIQEFKFTNIRREHDRQTRYLIQSVVKNNSLTLEDKILNCFMFRTWNNNDTFYFFGFPHSAEYLYEPEFKEHYRKTYQKAVIKNPDRKWWSNAYNQGGTKAAWKFPDGDGYQRAYKESDACMHSDWEKDIPLRPFHVAVWIGRNNVIAKLLKAKDQQEAFEIIKTVRGFADFLAYQVFVDLTYIKEFPFSENEFVVAGPGCKKGLDLIFKDSNGMNYSEQMFWLRNAINQHDIFSSIDSKGRYDTEKGYSIKLYKPEKLFDDLPEYDRKINVMSIENCMCELSKYVRAANGTGRPRNKYRGGK